ncbi:hypothetical protein Rsub_00963 [Raphidocelis subcapitata]|uniref:Uncharacterized protein n=1 Tax=Raphidocelis subcapitata TaxID=307507 RepID=A0A2V0NLG9_9CHLO|nr:hypothetical protein Rsub_00963 [Raphidocelis subcapitata]|eukprot:GBF88251.1 hypothetical protein Rsub_00963 [Raphidocelis subcapitata]
MASPGALESAPAPGQLAANDAPAPSARKQLKKERAAMAALAGELSAGLGSAVASVDQHLGAQDPALRAWAKQRRKGLRELLATAADAGKPLEERVRVLQRALVSEVENALAAEARSQRAVAELVAAEDMVAKRTDLCTKLERVNAAQQAQLQATNAANEALAARCKESESRFEDFRVLVENVQESVAESAEARDAIVRENNALRKTNEVLAAQNEALQKYTKEAEQRMGALDDLRDKIEAQAKAHEGLQDLRKLLEQQAADNALLAQQLEQRQKEVAELRGCLSKAQEVIKMQEDTYTKRREEFEQQVAGFQKGMKSANKLIADMGKRTEALAPLVGQNRALLDEATALRAALRRAEAQREQLAALCRALRGGAAVPDAADNGAGADGGASTDGTAAHEGEAAAEGEAEAPSSSSTAGDGGTAAAAAEADAAAGEPASAEGDAPAAAASAPAAGTGADS